MNDYSLRFAAVAYPAGAVSIWAIGPDASADTLEEGVKHTSARTTRSSWVRRT